jgi:hypothetical protein
VRGLGGEFVFAIEYLAGAHGVFHHTPSHGERMLDLVGGAR